MVAQGKESAEFAMTLGTSECNKLWSHCGQYGRKLRLAVVFCGRRIRSSARMTRYHVHTSLVSRLSVDQ